MSIFALYNVKNIINHQPYSGRVTLRFAITAITCAITKFSTIICSIPDIYNFSDSSDSKKQEKLMRARVKVHLWTKNTKILF